VSRDAYLLETVRTPRGKATSGGGLSRVPPVRLLETLLAALVERTGLDPGTVDDVIVGCASQVGDQGGGIARTAVLGAGWPPRVPGMTVNRYCASGLDAIAVAAALVRSGQAELVVAGGVESVSRVPMYADRGPLWCDAALVERLGSVHMGIAADVVATEDGYDRAELDAYGVRTQQRAAAAWRDGRFARSLVPVRDADGTVLLDRDEHVRPGVTAAAVAALEPAFAGLGASGQDALVLRHLPALGAVRHLHTRATSPSVADGAGLVLVASAGGAEALGAALRARIVASASAGGHPVRMLLAGQDAARAALDRAGIRPEALDVVEFAEAFAALCLKIEREFGLDDAVLNPNGGTIAMGHAFGATGAILVAGCVDELERRAGRYGLAAVSGAAGSGAALVLERVP
jgi:acetyl-CoA C-acetyltransferase